ncbi:phosphoenolpyruvate synthase [Vibrio sp. JPW-9-11-11]|uniref:putative PEP-binding protein n=1 Tax=Vibrio sp. JPW-9-11-11 TaxID=1416532 RepID=UPI0015930BB2|nr:putative PEP-binding protein [Vibrio sp. JPW-9-11-11]NVD06619.1 phosphoenolpyruvate synthase [Vibrio sp. JPW-9-11-11]
MSLNSSSSLYPALNLGQSLPSIDGPSGDSHLYVSLSELILEQVFYHPLYQQGSTTLEDLEQSAIDAILGEQEVETHFVQTLTDHIESAILPQHRAVRVSLSCADSDSFRSLLGGKCEDKEANPALGVRGVSRYAQPQFGPQFALECQVIKALQQRGHTIDVVVPFVRGLSDAAKVIDLLAEQGLPRGLDGLKVLYRVDVPSAALLSERLLHYFDGLVINLENLTQFALGVDRFNEALDYLFDPQSEAVVQLIDLAVAAASASHKPVIVTSSGLINCPRMQEYLADQSDIELVVTV